MTKWGGRIALASVSILVALLGVELTLRLVGYDPLGERTGGEDMVLRPSSNPDLGYDLRPGARGGAWQVEVAINSHGFRDREYEAEKPAGTRRIAVIGDSIAFGTSLAVEDTFSHQLEEMLGEIGADIEVLNLGVGGYDTINEVAFLKMVGVAFSPDLVIVAYCVNDVGTHSVQLKRVRMLERYRSLVQRSRVAQLVAFNLSAPPSALPDDEASYHERYSDSIQSVRQDTELQAILVPLRDQLRPAARKPLFLSWYGSEARIGRLRHAFGQLAELSAQYEFEVWVAIVPSLNEGRWASGYARAYAIVEHEVTRQGFRVVNLRDAFNQAGVKSLALRYGEKLSALHPNRAGHRIIADRLLDELQLSDSFDVPTRSPRPNAD